MEDDPLKYIVPPVPRSLLDANGQPITRADVLQQVYEQRLHSAGPHFVPQANRETYAQELRRRSTEQGRELRDSVPNLERGQDRSEDLER